MALPLLWIGAAAVAAYTGVKYSDRLLNDGSVHHFPGNEELPVTPIDGAIVHCEIFGVLDHTGIWVDGKVIELNGNGLVRIISPDRFLHNRTGEDIFVACDPEGNVLADDKTVERAVNEIYQYRDYDVLKNNCHHFVWEMITGKREKVGLFSTLNERLSDLHQSAIAWRPLKY